jgi:hypothetical protein
MRARTQVLALVRLRWTLVRSRAVRFGLLSAVAGIPLLGALVLAGRSGAEPAALVAVLEAAPAAFLGFGALAVIAPLTAGGSELVPSDQLVAYPVRPGTLFLSSLVLAPVNLVWIVQLLVLTAETGFLTLRHGSLGLGLLTSFLYVVACTAVGQAVAWTLIGLRRSSGGRIGIRCALGVLGVLAVVVVRTGHSGDVVDESFGPTVARAVVGDDSTLWWTATAVLALVAVVAFATGVRACRWALRRPADQGADRTSREVRRRGLALTPYQALVVVDRASVWRAPALRRGAIVLAVLPGLAAAGVGMPWRSLVFLPGLVAAGGGLLFGFNAFCLDASGAVWVASLPHPPALVARAKARVTAESVLAAALLAAVIGSIRAIGTPTVTELTAIVASAATCSLLVVALCLSTAVKRPHRADLNGPRDAVAPPGAMVLTSTKLALPAALLGGVLEASTSSAVWWVPLVIALPVAAGSAAWIAGSLRSYDDPWRRSRIVQTVSAG